MTAGCGDYPVWAAALARRSSTLPERLAPPSSSTARMRPRVDARLGIMVETSGQLSTCPHRYPLLEAPVHAA